MTSVKQHLDVISQHPIIVPLYKTLALLWRGYGVQRRDTAREVDRVESDAAWIAACREVLWKSVNSNPVRLRGAAEKLQQQPGRRNLHRTPNISVFVSRLFYERGKKKNSFFNWIFLMMCQDR